METVTVRIAYEFACPKCGTQNFTSAVVHEFTQEEKADAVDEIGELPSTGDWVTHPEVVQCMRCGKHFQAVNVGELVADPADAENPG